MSPPDNQQPVDDLVWNLVS